MLTEFRSSYKYQSIIFLAFMFIWQLEANALAPVSKETKSADNKTSHASLPRGVSVTDESSIYPECKDLNTANIDRNSLVIMAVENSHENQNAEFWVVKPKTKGGTTKTENLDLKSVSITCYFKLNLPESSSVSLNNGQNSGRMNQLMLQAINSSPKKVNQQFVLNPYSSKSYFEQIDEQTVKKEKKERRTKETAALLNSILGAVGVEVFAGGSWTTPTGDGTWRQEKYYPYEINATSVDYGAGISIKPTPKDEIRIGYQHLLSFSINALANASDYNTGACHAPNSTVKCWPVSHWYSKGGVNQVYATYGRKFFVFGFPLIAEVGVNINRATYTVTVPDYNGGGPEDGPPSKPHFLQVSTPVKTRIAGSFGIGVQPLPKKLPGLTLMASAEFPVGSTDDIKSGYYGFVVSLNARYRFCLLESGNCKR